MKSAKELLSFIYDNWTLILVVIGLIVGGVRKIKTYISLSDDEKLEVIKKQISEKMLKMITDAEINFEDWNKAGAIKRSQVIGKIFDQYPILSKIVDQSEIITWIDNEINESLKELRKIIKEKDEPTVQSDVQ